MGYSKNRGTLLKLLPQLEMLQKGQLCTWDVEEGTADYFAYRIREALYIAKQLPTEFPELAKQYGKVRVVVNSPSQVELKPVQDSPTATALAKQGPAPIASQSSSEGGVAGPNEDQGGPMLASDIVAEWHRRQPSTAKMSFPKAQLSNEELVKLYNWAKDRTPPWLVFAFEGAVTLQPYSRDMEDVAFNPSDLETPTSA